MNVVILESKDWQRVENAKVSKEELHRVLSKSVDEVSTLIALPEYCNITLRPTKWGVIPEYGVGGYTEDAELVKVVFDYDLPFGIGRLKRHLRETVYHELCHINRWMTVEYDEHLLSSVVSEGLAVVFERDFAGANPPYGAYDGEPVREWIDELDRPNHQNYDHYFFNHPDGRRWIGYKAGTWLIDRAIRSSGKTVIDLMPLDFKDIIELAHID